MMKRGLKNFLFIFGIGIICTVLFLYSRKVNKEIAALKQENCDQKIAIEATNKQVPLVAKYMLLVKNIQEESNGKLSSYEIVQIAKIITEQCVLNEDVGLTPALILAVMERESAFDPQAISSAKAYGLMQVIQITFDKHLTDLGYEKFSKDLALNPIVNVEVGIKELVQLRKYWLEEGVDSWMIAVNSYFWGVRITWELFLNKKRTFLPSLEYGKGVLDLVKVWKDRGLD